MMHTQDEGWDVGPGFFESVWRYRWLAALGLLLGVAAGYALAQQQQTLYLAESRIMLADPRNVGVFRDLGGSATEAGRHVRNQAEQINSEPVRARARTSEPGLDWSAALIAASPSVDTDTIVLQVRHPDAEQAAAIANALVEAYDATVAADVQAAAQRAVSQLAPTEQEYERQLLELERRLSADPDSMFLENQYRQVSDQLAEVRRRARAAEIDAALFGGGIRSWERAVPPDGPVQPRPARAAAMGGAAGLVLAGLIAWWWNARRDDVPAAMAEIFDVPQLAEIPDFERTGRVRLPRPWRRSDLAATFARALPEPYHFLATSVALALRDHDTAVVVVTSMLPGEGKSMTALSLAAAAARNGKRTLLLDGDLHRSELAGVVPGLGEGPGLLDLARGDAFIERAARPWPIAEHLYTMRLGARGAVEPSFLRSEPFRRWVRLLGTRFDLVVIDAPPVLPVLDAIDLAEPADGFLLVVTPATQRDLLERGAQRLRHTATPVVGYVLNRSGAQLPTYAYAYERRTEPQPRAADTRAEVVEMRRGGDQWEHLRPRAGDAPSEPPAARKHRG